MNPEELYQLRIEALAQKIKDIRIAAGYTSYEKFALQNDLDRKQYWRLEKGQNITFKSLFRILDIHKMTLAEFVQDLELPSLPD